MGICPKVGAKLHLFYQLGNFFGNYFHFIVKKKPPTAQFTLFQPLMW